METLKALLKQNGRNPEEADALASKYGYAADALTDADAQLIIQEELQASALAPTSGKPAPPANQKGRGRQSAKQVKLEDAIIHAAKETETELTTMETAIRQHKGKYVKARTKSIVNEIRNTSTEIVQGVTEKLMEETADAESFLEIGNTFGANLFPSFAESEA
jgi:hypothetical protein